MMNADNVSFYNEYQKFRDYVLYADTSFWVELADQPDAQHRLRSFLQGSGKTVQVPRDVLDLKNRHSVQSFKKIQVKRLTSNWYLGRVLPMPELPPQARSPLLPGTVPPAFTRFMGRPTASVLPAAVQAPGKPRRNPLRTTTTPSCSAMPR